MWYYVLDLTDIRRTKDIDNLDYELVAEEITEYVIEYGLQAMNDKNIQSLAKLRSISFWETLRDVFVAFLEIEHEAAKQVCSMDPRGDSNKFISEYTQVISQCQDSRKIEKCDTLVDIIHKEDYDLLYEREDAFLSGPSNYKQAVILLDNNKEYVGHIYFWSWLTANKEYTGDPFMLEFGGIRTSLKNLLCGGVKSVAPAFINIIAKWGKEYGWKSMHVFASPVGAMPFLLDKCGFSKDHFIRIEDIKCSSTLEFKQLHPETDKYGFVEEDFEDWYEDIKSKDEKLLKSMWFSYDIAADLHRVLMMSYPDLTPSADDLENLYITTFRNNEEGYKPMIYKKLIRNPKTIADFYEVRSNLNKLKEKDSSFSLYKYRSDPRYKAEIESKIIELEDINMELEDELGEFNYLVKNKDRTSQEDKEYNICLRNIFKYKVKTNELVSWYKILIKASFYYDNPDEYIALDILYDYQKIGSLLGSLKFKFGSISFGFQKLFDPSDPSNSWNNTDIMKIFIISP